MTYKSIKTRQNEVMEELKAERPPAMKSWATENWQMFFQETVGKDQWHITSMTGSIHTSLCRRAETAAFAVNFHHHGTYPLCATCVEMAMQLREHELESETCVSSTNEQ